jgi:hypothetical protein
MTDHIKAAHSLEAACILICDANNHIDPKDTKRIERMRGIIAQLGLEAENLRLSTLKVIEGGKA